MPSEDLHPWAFNLCPFFVWSGRLSFQHQLCQSLAIHLPRHICPIWREVGSGTNRSGYSDGPYPSGRRAWAIGQTLKPEQMLWLIINWIIKDIQLVFRLDHMVCMNYFVITWFKVCLEPWEQLAVDDLKGASQKPLQWLVGCGSNLYHATQRWTPCLHLACTTCSLILTK